jgi:NAD(P)-dependent dehydrogenase (short-subunit alcohol dehydrogenase family)
MFTFALACEFDPKTLTANCLHPATYMATTMVRQSGVTPISTVEEGAVTALPVQRLPLEERWVGMPSASAVLRLMPGWPRVWWDSY